LSEELSSSIHIINILLTCSGYRHTTYYVLYLERYCDYICIKAA